MIGINPILVVVKRLCSTVYCIAFFAVSACFGMTVLVGLCIVTTESLIWYHAGSVQPPAFMELESFVSIFFFFFSFPQWLISL